METINSRALELETRIKRDLICSYDALVKIATEQREIDITNAQDFYCDNLCPAYRLAGSCSDETFKECKIMRAMRKFMI